MPVEHSPPERQTRSQARAQAALTPTPRVPLDGTPAGSSLQEPALLSPEEWPCQNIQPLHFRHGLYITLGIGPSPKILDFCFHLGCSYAQLPAQLNNRKTKTLRQIPMKATLPGPAPHIWQRGIHSHTPREVQEAGCLYHLWMRDRIACSLRNPISTPATPIAAGNGVKKGDVKFLLNTLRLGEFTAERRVNKQEGAIARYMCPITIPKGFFQAMWYVDSSEWPAAITTEVNNMRTMEVFDILPLPPQKHAIWGGWVFSVKGRPGVDLRYKARYVACGNLKHYDTDFKETFAFTASFSSLRLLLTIAAH
ncbi:hypothetical protein O181_098568 [Austropuccinia psidii MF-1]|uniref:Reverse transcriptase Ty1/copia-type domain-containing protein n=1 Tax=Austropuccinia psidii MF-1 TaxID=1389203 RepID=A0A9Q3JB27_9BASI|nr:hypothetical protein [Austropuccinia psidii MF-1]